MSKQSFTTGQVLTAAQVNSLQSNDFNQTVSVKTDNYTLVAADKGTRIEFNTSGSVTCTVNTGLFDAGDTLVIQNRGAGTATITAGTATVNTSASLALAQYSAGTLYFVSASAALFFGDAAGISASIVDAKGDLIVGTADNTVARLAVGTNGHTLVADSVEATGMKWAAPSSGGMTLLSTTSLTGASTTISSISGSYKNLYGVIYNVTTAADGQFRIAPNNVTNLCNYSGTRRVTSADLIGANDDYLGTNGICESTVAAYFEFLIEDYANTSNFKPVEFKSVQARSDTGAIQTEFTGGYFRSLSAVTSLVFSNSGGNLSGGTVLLYGVS